MGIPSNPIAPGTSISGKISWFNDGTTASGANASTAPGIALYNQSTLGGYWLVNLNGRKVVEKQIDLGPAPWTNRIVDFGAASLGHYGYNAGNFPTDSTAQLTYLGKTIPKNYMHLANPGGNPQSAKNAAQQRAGISTPDVQTSFSGGQTDWSSAGVAALMSGADKPIDISGKVHTDNVLGRLVNAVASGQYTTPSQANSSLSNPNPAAKAVAQHQAGVARGPNGLVNPLHGFSGLSFDKGIDGSAPPGTPIRAPAASTLVDVIPDFYKGQPLLLFKFDHPIPGAPSQYWFTSEQINPVTRTIGSRFGAGQAVATFASSGTGMETGWGSPHTNDRRFAPVEAHYGQAHTGWGWHFAKFFGIG